MILTERCVEDRERTLVEVLSTGSVAGTALPRVYVSELQQGAPGFDMLFPESFQAYRENLVRPVDRRIKLVHGREHMRLLIQRIGYFGMAAAQKARSNLCRSRSRVACLIKPVQDMTSFAVSEQRRGILQSLSAGGWKARESAPGKPFRILMKAQRGVGLAEASEQALADTRLTGETFIHLYRGVLQ